MLYHLLFFYVAFNFCCVSYFFAAAEDERGAHNIESRKETFSGRKIVFLWTLLVALFEFSVFMLKMLLKFLSLSCFWLINLQLYRKLLKFNFFSSESKNPWQRFSIREKPMKIENFSNQKTAEPHSFHLFMVTVCFDSVAAVPELSLFNQFERFFTLWNSIKIGSTRSSSLVQRTTLAGWHSSLSRHLSLRCFSAVFLCHSSKEIRIYRGNEFYLCLSLPLPLSLFSHFLSAAVKRFHKILL